MPRPSCYMCAAGATSREHVPPKNLFPEAKDVGGRNYRLNLITVPSCDNHNSQKKRDDEFLMVSLAGIVGNNSLGVRHRLGKVDRAVRASAYKLLSQVVLVVESRDLLRLTDNAFVEIIWGTPDLARLVRCFEHIAYGIHHHHFSERFDGRLHLHVGYLKHKDHNSAVWNRFLADRVAFDLEGTAKCGSNPDVFYYQVSSPDQFGFYLIKLCFYGGLDVFVAFQPSGVEDAAHLGTALTKTGVPTVFTLGDRTYVFNSEHDA